MRRMKIELAAILALAATLAWGGGAKSRGCASGACLIRPADFERLTQKDMESRAIEARKLSAKQ